MSDEAVRKEFEAWVNGPGVKLSLQRHGSALHGKLYSEYTTHVAWMTWQASRSEAIEECADRLRAMNHPVYADMILLALKERG